MKGIQLTGYGNPTDVVKLVDAPDIGAPGPDEIVINIEAAPVEPSDLYTVAGIYGVLPPLPHFLGIQGVGRVSAIGRNVKHLKEGDRTITPLFTPSWVERVKTNSPWLRSLPNGDINQLAMLGINPATAYVVWSAMSGKPFNISGPPLLFRDQTIRGMWIYNWYKLLSPERITAMYAELVPLVLSGELSFPIARQFSFEQYRDALGVAAKYSGKAILTPKG